jgi:hypothetical protein
MVTAKMWAMATATRVADDEGVRERRPTTSMMMMTMTTTAMMMTMMTNMTTMTMTTAVAVTTTVTAADDDVDNIDEDNNEDDNINDNEVGGPQEKMHLFQIASGSILSIPIYLKTCLYGPCKFPLKKNDPFLI